MTLTDGRGELYQWDTGRTLTVDDATVTQVHFQNRAYGRTIDVDVKDGSAIIPDELLQKAGDLRVYAFSGTAASGFTKVERVFNIVRRNKPNDYMFTPTEQKSLEGLQKQIGDLSELKTDAKTDLVAAINETATAGQTLGLTGATVGQIPTVKSIDETGKPTEWEAVTDSTPFIVEFSGGGLTDWPYTSSHTFEQITVAISAGRYVIGHAEELMVSGDPSGSRYNIYFDLVSTMDVAIFQFVDASNRYQINVAIPNVENASVNVFGSYLSASSSTYGGVKADSAEGTDTQPVRIGTDGKLYTAPGSSGGGTDTSLGLTGATVGQTVKIKAVGENGAPTEWEAADMASGGDGWTEIGELTVEGTKFIISDYTDGVITVTPDNGIYPSVGRSYVIRKPDYSAYINARIVATETEGKFTLVNLDNGAYAPSEDLTQYVIDAPDAWGELVFSNLTSFSYFKIGITIPLLSSHGLRSTIGISGKIQFSIGASCSNLTGGAVEAIIETDESPVSGKDYVKASFKGKSPNRSNGYDVIDFVNKSTSDIIKIGHYNGLMVSGTNVKLWGRS